MAAGQAPEQYHNQQDRWLQDKRLLVTNDYQPEIEIHLTHFGFVFFDDLGRALVNRAGAHPLLPSPLISHGAHTLLPSHSQTACVYCSVYTVFILLLTCAVHLLLHIRVVIRFVVFFAEPKRAKCVSVSV